MFGTLAAVAATGTAAVAAAADEPAVVNSWEAGNKD